MTKSLSTCDNTKELQTFYSHGYEKLKINLILLDNFVPSELKFEPFDFTQFGKS